MSKTLRNLLASAALLVPMIFVGCEEEKKPATPVTPAATSAKPAESKTSESKTETKTSETKPAPAK